MYMNVHSSFICHRQNPKTSKMLFSGQMVEQWYIHTVEYYAALKKTPDDYYCSDLGGSQGSYVNKKSQSRKISCFFFNCKSLLFNLLHSLSLLLNKRFHIVLFHLHIYFEITK